jgi:uncharacterized protein YprB with RNaseH-like and TPR domain
VRDFIVFAIFSTTRMETHDNQQTKRTRCGYCKQEGHNKRTCPSFKQSVSAKDHGEIIAEIIENEETTGVTNNEDGEDDEAMQNNMVRATQEVQDVQHLEDNASPSLPEQSGVNWNECLFIIFDLETTGFVATKDEIIKIAAILLSPKGNEIEDGTFECLIKPQQKISSIITDLTGITNEMVKESPTFPDAIKEFFTFLSSRMERLTEDGFIINYNILVAHNGRRFNI